MDKGILVGLGTFFCFAILDGYLSTKYGMRDGSGNIQYAWLLYISLWLDRISPLLSSAIAGYVSKRKGYYCGPIVTVVGGSISLLILNWIYSHNTNTVYYLSDIILFSNTILYFAAIGFFGGSTGQLFANR